MYIKEEMIYVWLDMIEEIEYITFIKLINVFNSVYKLYEASNNKSLFQKILIQNNVFLSNKLLNKLTDFNLKKESKIRYYRLLEYNIIVVSITSKKYPKEILNYISPPICIYIKGNINNLNNFKIYLHKEKFNKYGDYLYIYFKKKFLDYNDNLKENKIALIYDFAVFKQEYINNFDNVNNSVILVNNEYAKYCLKYNKKNRDNLTFVFLNNKFNTFNFEYITCFSDICVIPQAKFDLNKKIKIIVDLFLEQSKEVFVVPGNIFCKFNYFSNYLIKEGANILLSFNDIKECIKNKK